MSKYSSKVCLDKSGPWGYKKNTMSGHHHGTLKRAENFAAEGKIEECIAVCDEMISDNAVNAPALNLKGFCLASLGRFDAAMPLFKLARLYLPDDPDIRYNLGKVLDDTGDLAGAILEYTEALKLAGGHRKSLLCRGSVRLRKGDLAQALDDLNAFLKMEPDLAEGLRLRGACLLLMDDTKGADVDFKAAIKADPQLKDDIDALKSRYSRLPDPRKKKRGADPRA